MEFAEIALKLMTPTGSRFIIACRSFLIGGIPVDKHIIYHALLEKLNQEVCPICKLIEKNVSSFIDGFLYEGVNGTKLRESIKSSKGFCHFHAWKLQMAGDPLAHAIIYEELLKMEQDVLERFKKQAGYKELYHKLLFLRKGGVTKLGSLKEWFSNKNVCPICKIVVDDENNYLFALQEYVAHDDEFRQRYRAKGFLCRPHFYKAIERFEDQESVNVILDTQLERIKKLMFFLEETKRKSDYRFADEPKSEEERVAWIHTVGLWVGDKDVK